MSLRYEVQYKLSSSSTWLSLTRNASSPLSISGLASMTNYDFRIRTVDPFGRRSGWYSLLDIIYPDTQVPSIPSNLRIETVGPDYFLFWDTSIDDVEVVEYEVQVSIDGVNYSSLATVEQSETVFVELTGLIFGTTYYYRVRAIDSSNNTSDWTTFTYEHVDTISPSEPTNFIVLSRSDTTMTLEWDASTDNVGVTSYEVEYRQTGIGTYDWWASTSLLTTTITGLSVGSGYDLRVRAVDAENNVSNWVTLINESTYSYPLAPTNIDEVTVTSTSITINWIASVEDGIPVEGYEVQTKLKSDPNSSFVTHSTVLTNQIVLSGLTSSTIYSVRVRAVYNTNQYTTWAPSDDGFTISTIYTQNFTESGTNQDVTFLNYETILTAYVVGGGGAGGGCVNAGLGNKNAAGGGGAGGVAFCSNVSFPASSTIRFLIPVNSSSNTLAGANGSLGTVSTMQYPIGSNFLSGNGGIGGFGRPTSGNAGASGGAGGSFIGQAGFIGGNGANGTIGVEGYGGSGGGATTAAAGSPGTPGAAGTGVLSFRGEGGLGGITSGGINTSTTDLTGTSPWRSPTAGNNYGAGGGGGATEGNPTSPSGATGRPGGQGYATISYYYRG